jgi:hypothetical protein
MCKLCFQTHLHYRFFCVPQVMGSVSDWRSATEMGSASDEDCVNSGRRLRRDSNPKRNNLSPGGGGVAKNTGGCREHRFSPFLIF